MALKFHSGFELGDFGEWSSIVGSPSVVGTQKKTGSYAMQCDTTGGAATSYVSTALSTVKQISFYLYIATAPDATRAIVGMSILTYQIELASTRYIRLGGGYQGTTQLALNTWYRISAAVDNEASGSIKVWINGEIELDLNPGTATTDRVYDNFGMVEEGTADLYFDNIICGTSTDLTDLGDIRVARASPNAAGTYAQYDSVSGYTNVDEIPASDVDFIEDNGSDAARESYNIPNLADLDGASTGDTVNAVSIWIRGDRDGGGATDHKAMVRDNSADYESSALAFNGIAWFNWYLAVMPDDSASWIEARLNSLEIGAYHLGGQDQRIHCLVAMVAYTPAGVQDYPISITVGLSLAATIDRDTAMARATSSNLSLTSSLSRVLAIARATTSNLSLTASLNRIRGWIVSTASNLNLTTNISRVVTYARAIASNLSLTATISRTRGLIRTTSSNLSLATSIVITTIQEYLITITANLSLATIVARSWTHTIATSTNLSLAATVDRAVTFVRAMASNLSLATSISRIVAYARASSSNLSLTVAVSKIRGWIVATSVNLNLTTTISRVVTWTRTTSSGLSLAASIVITTIHEYLITITANLSLATIVARSWGRTIATSTSLSLAVTIDRVMAFARVTASNLSVTTNVSRVAAFARAITSNLALTTILSRALTYTRAITSNLFLMTIISRVVNYPRVVMTNLALTTTISRVVTYMRAITAAVNLTTIINRIARFTRATASSLSLTVTISRVRGWVRTISLGLSLRTTITAIAWYCNPLRIPIAAMAVERVGIAAMAFKSVVKSRLPWCKMEEK